MLGMSLAWMQTGHATAYRMGGDPGLVQGGRREPLDAIAIPVSHFFGWTIGEWQYCWFFMALKGLLICLPLGCFAPAGAILWPTAYWIGIKIGDGADEFLSGCYIGALCSLVMLL